MFITAVISEIDQKCALPGYVAPLLAPVAHLHAYFGTLVSPVTYLSAFKARILDTVLFHVVP